MKEIVIAAALGVCACAARAPLALHADIAFSSPERESCVEDSAARTGVSVSVRDEAGAAFPGAAVYMLPMSVSSDTPVMVKTDHAGVAFLETVSPGVYAITVVLGGFTPQVRALNLRTGCTGSTRFTLKVGPMVVEK